MAKFSPELIETASKVPLNLELFRVKDESYKAQQIETFYRGYLIKDSPIVELNGRFMEMGIYYGCPYYKHVRKWLIMRCQLPEIPELGITMEDAQLLNDQRASAEKYFEKAEVAFEALSMNTRTIKEGSADFTKLFVDIARAGNKMVTADQTLTNLTNTNRRSEFQTRASMHLLRQIARHGILNNPSNQIEQSKSTESTTTSDDHDDDGENGGLEIPLENVDLQMIFSKNISYQPKDYFPEKLKNSEILWSAESELASELLHVIEEREVLVERIQQYAAEMEKLFLENSTNYESLKKEGKDMFEDILGSLRLKTLELSKVYASWARLYMRAQRKKSISALKVWEKHAYHKNYCVIVGFYSIHNLYGSSQPIQSDNKRNVRPFEAAVKALELKYIGEFSTEQEALDSFYHAMKSIPLEQIHPKDLAVDCKPSISFRPCKRHYLVRSATVPAGIPCEQCNINEKVQTFQTNTKIYPEIDNEFPTFLYKTYNYNQKVFSDLGFLRNLGIINKLYDKNQLDFLNNPLLLPRDYTNISEHKKGQTGAKNLDPLFHLKGKKEFLFDALQYSQQYRAELKREKFEQGFRDHPLNASQVLPKLIAKDQLSARVRTMDKRGNDSVSFSKSADFSVRGSSSLPQLSQQLNKTNGDSISLQSFWDTLLRIPENEILLAMKVLSQTQSEPLKNEKPDPSDDSSTTSLSKRDSLLGHSKPDLTALSLRKSNLMESTFHGYLRKDKEKKPSSKTLKPVNFLEVTTEYQDRAVKLSTSQKRFPPAYREDDVFCRTDIGEFAGFTKGRAVRAYDFKENLYRSGKEKEEIRKDMQRRLREAVAVHIINCDVPFIEALIEEAKLIRGSILNLDIIQAENFIKRFHSLCKWTLRAQCIYRGNKGRKMARSRRLAMISREKYLLTTEKESLKLARLVVPEITRTAVGNQIKARCQKPFYSMVLNMSGFSAVISLFEGSRWLRKSKSEVCSVCASNQFHVRCYPRISTTIKERMPCTCPLEIEEENWLARFYFPLLGTQISKRFNVSAVRKILLDYEFNKFQFMNGSFLNFVLKSDPRSFDDIEPLLTCAVENHQRGKKGSMKMANLPKTVDIEYYINSISRKISPTETEPAAEVQVKVKNSFTRAWLQSAKESSVLPRLTFQQLPDNIRRVLRSGKGKKRKLANIVSSQRPETRMDFHSAYQGDFSKSVSADVWKWEPVGDYKQSLQNLSQIKQNILISQERRDRFKQQLDEFYSLKLSSLQDLETSAMEFEDQLSVIASIYLSYQDQLRKNQEIMQFSKDLHYFMDLLEKQEIADNSRSYDQHEDGFQWKEMNKLIQFQKKFRSEEQLLPSLFEKKILAVQRYRDICEEINILELSYETAQQDLEFFLTALQREEAERLASLSNLKKTMKLFLSQFSFPQKLAPSPPARHVAIFPYNYFLIKDPLQRLKKENRKVMIGLMKQAVSLSASNSAMMSKGVSRFAAYLKRNALEACDPRELLEKREGFPIVLDGSSPTHRFIVTVFLDELSGNIVINLNGKSILTEEGNQHLDLGLHSDTFSKITKYIQTGDIVVTAQDLLLLLKKSPRYFETYSTDEEKAKRKPTRKAILKSLRFLSCLDENFIPPSKRERSLANYAVISPTAPKSSITKINPVQFLGSENEGNEIDQDTEAEVNSDSGNRRKKNRTFYRDYLLQEKQKTKFAEKIVSYLKIQPHTSRPCLGLLHLIRRSDFSFANWRKCLWFNDQLSLNPSVLPSEIFHGIVSRGTSERVLLRISHHLSRIDLQLQRITPDSVLPLTSRLQIQTNFVLDSILSLNQPLTDPSSIRGLAWSSNLMGKGNLLFYLAFLQRIILGNYWNFSQFCKTKTPLHFNLVNHLVDRTVPSRNGVLTNHAHRQTLQYHENLPLLFRPFSDDLFLQSSNLRFYRFICNVYCLVKIYVSGRENFMKVEIHSPNDGNYMYHQYRGKVIKIYWSFDFIRCFLLKQQQLVLLRHMGDSIVNIAQYLMDSLEFLDGLSPPGAVSPTVTPSPCLDIFSSFQGEGTIKSLSSAKFASEANDPKEIKALSVDLEKFKDFSTSLLLKYNYWVEKRHPHKPMKISSRKIDLFVSQIDSLKLADESRWLLGRKPSTTLNNMENKASLQSSITNDENKIPIFSGLWTFRSSNSSNQNAHSHSSMKETNEFMGNISLFVDKSQANLFLLMKESSDEEKIKEFVNFFLTLEREQMGMEDQESRILRNSLERYQENSRKFREKISERKETSLVNPSPKPSDYDRDGASEDSDYFLRSGWMYSEFLFLYSSKIISAVQSISSDCFLGNNKVRELINGHLPLQTVEEAAHLGYLQQFDFILPSLPSLQIEKAISVDPVISSLRESLQDNAATLKVLSSDSVSFRYFAQRINWPALSKSVRRYDRRDVVNWNCTQLTTDRCMGFRNSQSWFRDALVVAKIAKRAHFSTEQGFLIDTACRVLHEMNGENGAEIEICIEHLRLSVFGVLDARMYSLSTCQHFHVWVVPTYADQQQEGFDSLETALKECSESDCFGSPQAPVLHSIISSISRSFVSSSVFQGTAAALMRLKTAQIDFEIETYRQNRHPDDTSSNFLVVSETDSVFEMDSLVNNERMFSLPHQRYPQPSTSVDLQILHGEAEKFPASEEKESTELFSSEGEESEDEEISLLFENLCGVKKGHRSSKIFFSTETKRKGASSSLQPRNIAPWRREIEDDIHLFFIPLDEAKPITAKSLSIFSYLPFINEALHLEDFFSERFQAMYDKIVVFQNKLILQECEDLLRLSKHNEDPVAASKLKYQLQHQVNPRLKRLLPILNSQPPIVSGGIELSFLRSDADFQTHPCYGDCIIMLRKKDQSLLQSLSSLFHVWETEYLPLLQLKQEKAGRERQWKSDNQKKYSDHIFAICSHLVPVSEILFGYHHSLNQKYFMKSIQGSELVAGGDHYFKNENTILLKFVRLLFYWFDYTRLESGHSSDHWRERMRRIDPLTETNEYIIEDFDLRVVDFDLFASSAVEGSAQNNLLLDSYFVHLFSLLQQRNSLNQPQLPADNQKLLCPSQLLYCIYQLHCSHCPEGFNQCRFPHCNKIRCELRIRTTLLNPEDASKNSSSEILREVLKEVLCPSGRLLTEEEHFDKKTSPKCPENRYFTVADDIAEDELNDKLAVEAFERERQLSFNFKELEVQILWMEFLSYYMTATNEMIRSQVSHHDLLLSKGGLFYQQMQLDKQKLAESLQDVSSRFLPFLQFSNAVARPKKSAKRISRVSFIRGASRPSSADLGPNSQLQQQIIRAISNFEWNLSLPVDIIVEVLQTGFNFTPYPSHSVPDESQPLAKASFQQVMMQLKLCVNQSVGKYSSARRLFDAGRSFPAIVERVPDDAFDPRIIAFDRLLTEGVFLYRDSTVLVLQFFYGVLEETELLVCDSSPIPLAGLRFYPVEEMKKMKKGITLLIYDMGSETSRAVYINERKITKYIESLQRKRGGASATNDFNYQAAAESLLLEAKDLIDINRLEAHFLSIELKLNETTYQSQDSSKIKDIQIAERAESRGIKVTEKCKSSCKIDTRDSQRALIAKLLL